MNLKNGTTVAGTATLTADNNWTYTFTELPVKDSSGNEIEYTVEEVSVDGYTSTVDGYTIINTLDTGRLTLYKKINADSSITPTGFTYTFYVSGFADGVTSVTDSNEDSWSVSNGVAIVTVPAGGYVTLVDLPVGTYTVYESSDGSDITANGYTWIVSGDNNKSVAVTRNGEVSATITNTLTGTSSIFITKNWDDQSNKWSTRPDNDGETYYVTLTGYIYDSTNEEYVLAQDENRDNYVYTTTLSWSESTNSWSTSLTNVAAYDPDGNKITYFIKEADVTGYTLDSIVVSGTTADAKTYSDDATLSPTDTLSAATIIPADGEINVTLTNSLDTAKVTVTKTLKNSSGEEINNAEYNDDDFTMQLYTYDTNTCEYTEVAAHTLSLSDVMTYTFTNLPLGTYYLKEVLASDNDHAYTVTVTIGNDTVDANDDGYYVIKLTDADATVTVSVTNQEQEIDITDSTKTFPDVTKTYTSTNISNSENTTFTFYIMDTSGTTVATGIATTSVGASNPASVTWTYTEGAFTYTEVGTYVYTIREYDDMAAGVKYDDTVYTLVVTVYTDSNGKLTSSYEIYTTYNGEGDSGNVAVSDKTAAFTNEYSPSEINFVMRVRKVLTGRTIKEGEFYVTLQEYTYDSTTGNYTEEGEPIIVKNSVDSTFSHTFAYIAEGTYYYKAQEVDDSEIGMSYDSKTSWIKVVVGSEGNVLVIKSVEWVQFDNDTTPTNDTVWTAYSGTLSDYVAFQNSYTATGTATLTAYKDLTGRTLNEDEFTFLLVALDSTAPMPEDYSTAATGDSYVTDGYVVAGEHYVEATNEANGSINFGTITYTQEDIGKTYEYRVEEVVGTLNGVTYDTQDYGKLIYVTITDAGNGKLNVSVTNSGTVDYNDDNTTDVVIYNTFSQGSTTIYGTKSWVDGGASHDNEEEISLILYYRYLIPAEKTVSGEDEWSDWIKYSDNYTVTWGTLYTNNWHIADLPVYTEDGYKIQYSVLEEGTESVNGYVTTYDGESITDEIASSVVPEDNAADNRYIITNTIEQGYMSISGTKTWVESSKENHDNAKELVLTVSRNSDSTSLENLIQMDVDLENGTYGSFDSDGNPLDGTYIVVWSGDTYNIYWYYDESTSAYVGLPLYDSQGYKYSYKVAESYADDYADDYMGYEIETDWNLVSDTKVTFDFTNRAPDDAQEDPAKTETTINDNSAGDGEDATVNGQIVVEYGEVAVGDIITYTISYYNNANNTATVRITDPLDSGVDFVSASYGNVTLNADDNSDATGTGVTISYDSTTHTVTWEIETAAFTYGSVTLTVKVNSDARSIVSGETAATVDNQATVYNTEIDHEATTNIVTNPLKDDRDEETEKGIISVTYEDEDGNEYTRDTTDENGNYIVYEGDEIHYIITRYNNTNETVTFVIVDTLDEGVTYTYSSYGSTYYTDATTVSVDGYDYSIPAHSVVWIVTTNPYSYATVQMTVTVNSNAKTATQTYEATAPGTYEGKSNEEYTDYTYGTGDDTTASVANQAVAYTVGNDTVSYSNVVENPLDEDDPQDPIKSISENSPSGYTDDHDIIEGDEGEADTVTYDSVGVGSMIEYAISYYNHYNTAVTVTIVDELDDGVDFISATGSSTVDSDKAASLSEGGETDYVTYTYDSSTHTITWTIYNATPLTACSVVLVVQVNENALTTEAGEDTATVENQATVTVGGVENDTEIVVNPIDPDDPGDPEKVVSADSEAGVNGANVAVGDQITYTISYYNHTNTAAKVTIEDALDEGVDFISATESTEDGISYSYDASAHTVTWTIDSVAAYTGGTVDLIVEVNSSAETQVENDAVVTVGDNEATTNLVTNPVDDDPEDPTKTETGYGDGTVDENGDITYDEVAVGDEITYTITYYNHYGTEADITITDQLDPGVEFVSATDQNGDTLTADDVFADEEDTYVKWPVFTAEAYESGSVTLTVRVTEDAKTADSDGNAIVDNQAIVQIGNDSAVSTNKVTNPLEPDDPTEPTKSVDVGDGTEVYVGDELVYTVTYYNNLNTAATVIIEDELDEGVDFVEASDDGVYDADTHTVAWTIEDVSAFTEDCVILTVKVNEDAKIAEDSDIADVVNDADVTVGNQATQTTNLVENPLETTDPTDPTKSVDVGDGTKVSVRDKLVYTITYDNHLNTSATITITDTLDEGLTFVSASNGGKYDKSTRTVTWTIENVDAYTEGSVTLKVKVNSDADTSVENTAEVFVGDNDAVSTNTVENPVEQETTTVTKTKTGDSNRLSLWIVLLIASAAGLGSLGIYERKRRRVTNRK